jgi:hypothetical protein
MTLLSSRKLEPSETLLPMRFVFPTTKEGRLLESVMDPIPWESHQSQLAPSHYWGHQRFKNVPDGPGMLIRYTSGGLLCSLSFKSLRVKLGILDLVRCGTP